ncbi:MAG: bifunctional 5,10-methylenetetrahydrofolate dehydrogenase/5,10-methenyltetrahydrofolate cyclohydrolase [Planctomycetota bacterium]
MSKVVAANTIDGKKLAKQIRSDLAQRVESLKASGRKVRLDAVLTASADDGAARVYANNQAKTCESLGIEYHLHELPGDSDEDEILGRVLLLNEKTEVHAIMLHMPLPAGVDPYRIQRRIDPDKDVEGVNPANIGNIVYGRSSLAPCTALATVRMIESLGMDLKGKRAVVIGASNIVGKPVAALLMQHECTVISCNKFSEDVPGMAATADILVAAAGVRELVKADWVKEGAAVIDVGIHRVTFDPPLPDGTKRKTVGDVAFDEVAERLGSTGHISPVPGGVGPMTVAMLLSNVVDAAERSRDN